MIEFHDAERETWDTVFQQFDEANFLQSWEWGDMQTLLGNRVIRRVVSANNAPVGLLQATVKNARRGRYLELPSGPLIDWRQPDLVDELFVELTDIARKERCVFVRLRPQLPDETSYRQLFAQHGLGLSPMHLIADHTSIVDITSNDNTLLKNMRQQTRYEVRRADKRGVTVRIDTSAEITDTFHTIQVKTAQRQGFIPPSSSYLRSCMQALGDHARIYRADKDGQLLNLGLVIMYGHEAAYFEAASTPEARREPGAYAIIWQAMRDAREAGLTRFNLWGTAPADQPDHRFGGVTTFKRGFGGEDVNYLPAHDLVINRMRYRFNWLIETVRKKRRKL